MTDRELLELAARAAEYEYAKYGGYIVVDGIPGNWNPLTDDGDALRLAVKLQLSVDTDWYNNDACWFTEKTIVSSMTSVEEEPHNNDPYAATRRAIVRAAAEIGKQRNSYD